MKNLDFLGYKVKNSVFKNNLEKEQVSLKLSYNYSITENQEDPNLLRTECNVLIAAKEKNKFSIQVAMVGDFRKIGDISDEDVKSLTFDAMFPYIRSYVTSLTVTAGLPPLLMPFLDASNLVNESMNEE